MLASLTLLSMLICMRAGAAHFMLIVLCAVFHVKCEFEWVWSVVIVFDPLLVCFDGVQSLGQH